MLLGACSILFLPSIPTLWPLTLILLSALPVLYWQRHQRWFWLYRCLFALLFGACWALWHCQLLLAWQLPTDWQGQNLEVQGQIISLPQQKPRYVSFTFATTSINHQAIHTKLKLNWYVQRHATPIKIGQQWQMTLRLKRPHSLSNPGSFEYEKWLFEQGIRATGYVKSAKLTRANQPSPFDHMMGTLRQDLQKDFETSLGDKPLGGMITALSIGDKSHITQPQWQVLQHTGTSHLMAISGLHIGLIAGLAFGLIGFIWRRIPRAALFCATPRVAAIGGLCAAFIYSAMAGFSVSTQRALIMLLVFMGAIILRRRILPWSSLALAMLVILLIHPLSVLSTSFWLSFTAVALLIFGLSGRVSPTGWWWKIGRTQWVASIGLIPLTLWYFQNASIISPLANVIAIPWVGFITVPLTLIASGLFFISTTLAHAVLWLAYYSLVAAWYFLQHLAAWHYASLQHTITPLALLSAYLGLALVLAPRGWPNRYLCVLFFLPALLNIRPDIPQQSVQITLLDVGQGLATVVQTQHHVLIYDTGAKFSPTFDMGQAVVLPFLKQQHINHINRMVISHGDNDHIGGAFSILQTLPVDSIDTSVPKRFKRPANLCLRGQHWQWDGVQFEFLYPTPKHLGLDNDSSCVLRISTGQHHVLFTGDIERLAETYLVTHERKQLPADILIAPHHGSSTSSTWPFIKAVNPKAVLFPTGYNNRFHFPKPNIVKRYQQLGVQMFNTATDGAISFTLDEQGISKLSQYRINNKHIWTG
tara:strand:- start:182979 stop:185255 length:2277 start_codon:yes stop_codon:yes gene_type:complete